ncbi:hypothetical protein A4A49_07061 [Nicotiana attenuata]|uniref:Uncharacterized protein n=1 Tax=Nicotiana attenuata TaxID=49451 RepID=A0A1J6IPH9_NICAT|nr:hypothetical protein A4A49_07061 [Nicotiana attenuata]
MKGHRRENCYNLVEYPPNHKFNKRRTYDRPQSSGGNRRHSANNVSHVEEPEASGSSGISSMPMFTSEQYNQLLKLINHEPAVAEAKVNMAGIKEFLDACLLAGFEPSCWIIDIGSSNHMVSSLDLLT